MEHTTSHIDGHTTDRFLITAFDDLDRRRVKSFLRTCFDLFSSVKITSGFGNQTS